MEPRFLVELGKGRGKYEVVLATENEAQAYFFYNGYNVHSGYKKRLKKYGKVIERLITERE